MVTKEEILSKRKMLKDTKDYRVRRGLYFELRYDLRKNPDIIQDIAFDNNIDERVRYDIVFVLSTDHGGSCSLKDNPLWADMMRECIIPYAHQLPENLQGTVNWYQKVHGL